MRISHELALVCACLSVTFRVTTTYYPFSAEAHFKKSADFDAVNDTALLQKYVGKVTPFLGVGHLFFVVKLVRVFVHLWKDLVHIFQVRFERDRAPVYFAVTSIKLPFGFDARQGRLRATSTKSSDGKRHVSSEIARKSTLSSLAQRFPLAMTHDRAAGVQ